jgi:multidrug efflux system outer membrane protein
MAGNDVCEICFCKGWSGAAEFRSDKCGGLTTIAKQEQVLVYQHTIQQAFQSVSDALIGLQRYRVQEVKVTAAAEDATRLARLCYSAGSTSYLEVLTNDTN